MTLDRTAILAYKVSPRKEVKVPELKGTVWVKTMSAAERDQYEFATLADPKHNVRARMVAFCACDAEGVLLFTPADVAEISTLPVPAMQRIFAAALELNTFTKDDIADLEKN